MNDSNTLTFDANNSNVMTNNSNVTFRSVEHPIPFWIFLSAETIVTILGNAMLCLLFIRNKKLRTKQNYFIISLSTSDLLVGLSIVPCEYCRMVRGQDEACPVFCGSVISFNMIASIMNLVLIASDRYLAIKKPYRYLELISSKRAIIIISTGWVITIVLVCTPITWIMGLFGNSAQLINQVYSIILFAAAILGGILLAASYYSIVRTIRLKVRETKDAPSNSAGVKVCIISSVVFFFSWIPYCVIEIILQNEMDGGIHWIGDVAYFVLMLSPCLDPLLYAYYRRDFRGCLLTYYQRSCLRKIGRRVEQQFCLSKKKPTESPTCRKYDVGDGDREEGRGLCKVQSQQVTNGTGSTML